MMNIFFYCMLEDSSNSFFKIEWLLCEGNQVISEGEVKQDTPSYTYDFIMFLLAVGNADTMIGYDLDFKLKIIGRVMKRIGLTIERNEKIVHLDLKGRIYNPVNKDHKCGGPMYKPKSVIDLYDNYFTYAQS